jgi:hypothetical protein
LKAERKVQSAKKLKRKSPAQWETASPEELLEEKRSLDKFAQDMKPSLPGMATDQRDALLAELHRLANLKTFFDEYAATKREDVGKDVSRFREYRLWLADVDKRLSAAMKADEVIACFPRGDSRGTVVRPDQLDAAGESHG